MAPLEDAALQGDRVKPAVAGAWAIEAPRNAVERAKRPEGRARRLRDKQRPGQSGSPDRPAAKARAS